MRHFIAMILSATVGSVLGSPLAWGQSLKSGPQPGDFLPGPFHALNLNGKHRASPHCLVCEYGLQPVVMVFTRDLSKVTGLLQKLDEALTRQQRFGLRSFAVVLSEEFAKEANQKEVVQSMDRTASELKNLVIAVEGPVGPEKYNINKEAEVTVILYKKLKVEANFTFAKDTLTDKDVAVILAATDKMVTTP